MTEITHKLIQLYNSLDASRCTETILGQVYAHDVHFQDPFHDINGLTALARYMKSMYENVDHCQFHFIDQLHADDKAILIWQMQLRHPRLKSGQLLTIDGATHIRGQHKIHYHRDYFDGGQLLYEQIPILGGAIRLLKSRMAKEV